MFSPSHFRNLFQPNYCERRVWLETNHPELAVIDTDFVDMIQSKGLEAEKAHVDTIGPFEEPEYPEGDLPLGFEETLKLIEERAPIIYQGVLISNNGQLRTIPDLLVLDDKTGRYRLQEIKLAIRIENHLEISYGVGLSRMIAEEILGYQPVTEIITGDGQLVSPFVPPNSEEILKTMNKILELENLEYDPIEPVGWSKCKECEFFDYCYRQSFERHGVDTISGIEKGMVIALWGKNIRTWDDIIKIGEEDFRNIQFQRGKQQQRIGPTRGGKYYRQTKCLVKNSYEIISSPVLPPGYVKGQRPIVIFDVENTIFGETDIDVDVYIWGLMSVLANGECEQKTVITPPGDKGDYNGWNQFLNVIGSIFNTYGDIPFIHFSSHEITKIRNYIDIYGDKKGIAERLLGNMWDLYRCVQNSVVLPVPSYGLKQIEEYVGFQRSQQDYGGRWSLVRYHEYTEAQSEADASNIIDEIKIYNYEDLKATYSVYQWLENYCC